MQKTVTNAYRTKSFEQYNRVGRRRQADPAPRKGQHRAEGMWRKPMSKQHAPHTEPSNPSAHSPHALPRTIPTSVTVSQVLHCSLT